MSIVNFNVFNFVLRDSRFSLLDKIIYFACMALFIFSIYLIASSLWNLDLNLWGVLILVPLFSFSKKIHQKFVLPFNQATLAPERLLAVNESIEYTQYAIKTTFVSLAKAEIYTSLLIIVSFFLVFGTVDFLGKAGLLSYIWFVVAAELLVLFFLFLLLVVKPLLETTFEIRANKPKHSRLPLVYDVLIMVLFLGLILGFLAFRYQALTGRSFFHKFSSLATSPKNYLPPEYYLVIQLTRFTEDNELPSKNVYNFGDFTLDRSQKQLKLTYPKKEIERDLLIDDLDRILIFEIIDSELGIKYGEMNYVGLPYANLPLYFYDIKTDVEKRIFSPRIVGIDPDGTITVEREIFDLKVAAVEMRLRRLRGNSYGEDAGTVTENFKLKPYQTLDLEDKNGQQFKLIHLGVFPKSSIIYAQD